MSTERVIATENDLDVAVRCDWSPQTCLIAQSLKRHFDADAIINVDHMSAQLRKGTTLFIYDLIGTTRLQRKFDQAYPTVGDPDWERIANLRTNLPTIFHAKLVEEIEDEEEPAVQCKGDP